MKLSDLYAKLNKSTKKSGCIASVIVDYYGISARIVFVRNRNKDSKREWLAILSTNITFLTKEMIDKILDDFMKKLPVFIKNRLIKASA